ncbi:hypothetical protein HHK36_006972 [Tetracentron sinense]|uniref:F-box associated beta-propeller type 3 domain-containing protein n=1 Tax=Tetracentron sinense TaxID=13715 RepID=A0A835DLD6_TETSI|nr:hypothetical protein HHK36_006972 [Tetracentron sinense]
MYGHRGNVIHRFNKSLVDYCCDTDMLPTRFELVCFFEYNQIYVCNPSTQEFITISEPLPPNVDDLNSVGFGYTPSTKEYKLVRIFFRYWELPPFHVGCDVLTLGSCSWRAVKDPPFNTTTCRPAFVNGAIHWTINPDIPSYSDDETEEFGLVPHPDAILAFDVDTEEFRLVPHPENLYDPRETNDDIGLVELGGLLCLAVVVHRKRDMNIWMLTDYKNHVWVKEYSINLNTLDPYKTLGDFTARDIRGGKILIEDYRARLNYYDLQSKSFKRFEIDNIIKSPQFSFDVESFRSLGSRKKILNNLKSPLKTDSSSENVEKSFVANNNTASKGRGRGHKGRPYCTYCKKDGHVIDKCWKIHGKPDKEKAKDIHVAQSADNETPLTMEKLAQFFNQFGKVNIASTSPSCDSANGSLIPVKGNGKTNFFESAPSSDVLFVPEFSSNLLSDRATGKRIGEGQQVRGLYVLERTNKALFSSNKLATSFKSWWKQWVILLEFKFENYSLAVQLSTTLCCIWLHRNEVLFRVMVPADPNLAINHAKSLFFEIVSRPGQTMGSVPNAA